ncbi:MAG: hypothetical protein K8R86_10860 [Bacteroidales bacterium]|nr:hypothetical protein [Bacteroidales bacterium]
MTNSKVHKDEIDWLISIASTTEDIELRNESLKKLKSFGLTELQIKERSKELGSGEKQKQAFEKAWKKQAEKNALENYSLIEKIKIFLFGPYELFKHLNSGLTELKDFNYKIKLRQRLVLLMVGTLFWILLIISTYKYYEYQRSQEIEKLELEE